MLKSAFAARSTFALVIAVTVLTGCQSRWNPVNWFNGSDEVNSVPEGEVNPLLPRQTNGIFARPDDLYPGKPVDQVTDLRIDRTRSGAIIVAQGVGTRQGLYNAQLTPVNIDEVPVDGVLTYTFDVVYPNYRTVVGAEQTRTITAARSISNEVLSDTRVVRILGARNTRETRRR